MKIFINILIFFLITITLLIFIYPKDKNDYKIVARDQKKINHNDNKKYDIPVLNKKDREPKENLWKKAIREIYIDKIKREARYYNLYEGYSGEKSIALTFDDGPHPRYSLQLIDILRKHKVNATFFVVGSLAEKYPDIIRKEYTAGNVIANHTYHHTNLLTVSGDEAKVEWQACNNVIKSIIGINPDFCRPPGGEYDSIVLNAAENTGLSTVFWTANTGDYEQPGEDVILYKVFTRTGPGGIILMHDGVQETLDVLPEVIETFKNEGYKFVTVKDMALRR
jgi:peptidoglycan/xylan/chitin deacetylase (PgdA/CDA1 family)